MDVDRYTEFFKVLSNEARMRILFSLRQEEKTVTELTEAAECGQSCVSHHLKKLTETGLVQRRKEGNRRIYSLNEDLFESLISPVKKGPD